MVIAPQVLVPTLLVPLVLYRMYRRFRTSFGKQPIRQTRMLIRVVLLAAAGSLILWMALHSIALLGAATAGIALGGGLAVLGLRLTQWHSDETGVYFTPNAYVGAAVLALLIARMTYRIISLAPALEGAPQPLAGSFGSLQQSPLTLAILMVTVGYYLIYFTGLLIAARTRPGA